MASSMSRLQILQLYKTMMRESQKFPSYNYRHYALRRVRDAFKNNKSLTDPEKIEQQIMKARKNLNMIKRQVLVGDLYKGDKLIIEKL